jgi:hypothetical protein
MGKPTESEILTAPAYWQNYILHGDAARLSKIERLCADEWMKEQRVFSVIAPTGPAYESTFFVLYDKSADSAGELQDFIVLLEPKGV